MVHQCLIVAVVKIVIFRVFTPRLLVLAERVKNLPVSDFSVETCRQDYAIRVRMCVLKFLHSLCLSAKKVFGRQNGNKYVHRPYSFLNQLLLFFGQPATFCLS